MESYYALCGQRSNEIYTGNYAGLFEENYPNYIKIQQGIQNEKNINFEKRHSLAVQNNSQVSSSEKQINQSAVVDIESGSLGLSRSLWELKQGKPDTKCMSGYTCYKGGKYMVSFMDDRIWLMEVIVSPLPISEKTKGISINESRSLAKSLIPFDAKLMKTYTNRSGSTVDLYMSEALKTLEPHFPANAPGVWTGGEVGNFIVILSGTGNIKRIVIGTGNNP